MRKPKVGTLVVAKPDAPYPKKLTNAIVKVTDTFRRQSPTCYMHYWLNECSCNSITQNMDVEIVQRLDNRFIGVGWRVDSKHFDKL